MKLKIFQSLQLISFLVWLRTYQQPSVLFDGENILFGASLVIYINSTNIPPIMIILVNRIYETQNLLSLQLVSFVVGLRTYQHPCILFDDENISLDDSLVIYINSTNIPPIMIINRIYETQNLVSRQLISFLVWLRTYQHPGIIGDLLMYPCKPPVRPTRCVCPAVNIFCRSSSSSTGLSTSAIPGRTLTDNTCDLLRVRCA